MQLSLQEISKSFGGELIFSGVNARIAQHDRVGLVGINGAGKTTLLKIIAGELEPDSGEVTCSGDLSIGYQRQNSGLTHGSTIMEEMRSVFADVYETERRMREIGEAMAQNPADTALTACATDATITAAAFKDYVNGDFTPASGGALRNAGVTIANAPKKDLAGKKRIRNSNIDIGCYEYQPPVGLKLFVK